MKKFIVYIRVSTEFQNISGLGIEAQRSIAYNYAKNNGGQIIGEIVDVISGRKVRKYKNPQRAKRQLQGVNEALDLCKENNAILLVAKLDRLSRDVETLFKIVNSGADVIAADLPTFNTLTVGIFATFAQYEAELISERTKSALKAKTERGVKLGKAKGHKIKDYNKEVLLKRADRHEDGGRENVKYIIQQKRKDGKSYEKIAIEMNDENKNGRYLINGKKPKFHAVMIYRLLKEHETPETTPEIEKSYKVNMFN